jgi:hypothetical protein
MHGQMNFNHSVIEQAGPVLVGRGQGGLLHGVMLPGGTGDVPVQLSKHTPQTASFEVGLPGSAMYTRVTVSAIAGKLAFRLDAAPPADVVPAAEVG